MKIYKRKNQYLFVLPNFPQWFVVDELGRAVVLEMLRNKTLKQTIRKFSNFHPKEIEEIYNTTFPLIRTSDSSSESIEIARSLTSKTTVAMISITRKCNLRCPHCYVDARGARGNELTLSEHKTLAENLYLFLAVSPDVKYKVNLTGGEPFIHSEIINIIAAYKNVGFDVTMSTNGLLIRNKDMDALRDLEIALSISLDGATSKTHDFIRGEGAFNAVIKKIDKLVKKGVRVGINHLIHSGNFYEFEKVISLAYDLGCSGFNPINLVQLGRACDSGLDRVSEVKIFKRIAVYLERKPKQIGMFMFSSLFASLGAALLTGVVCHSCGIGNRPCVYIAETGDVFPCPNTQREEFKMGNIRTGVFFSCIDFDHPVLKRLRGIDVDTLNSKCSNCDVKYFCGGDCRGETYNVTRDLNSPYVACDDRHDSLVELMWIVAKHPEFFKDRANEYLKNSRAI